jgi:hypothetical protein
MDGVNSNFYPSTCGHIAKPVCPVPDLINKYQKLNFTVGELS